LGAVSTNDNKIYVIGGLPTSGLTVINMNEIFDVKRK
jgi:hypothetical protein